MRTIPYHPHLQRRVSLPSEAEVVERLIRVSPHATLVLEFYPRFASIANRDISAGNLGLNVAMKIGEFLKNGQHVELIPELREHAAAWIDILADHDHDTVEAAIKVFNAYTPFGEEIGGLP